MKLIVISLTQKIYNPPHIKKEEILEKIQSELKKIGVDNIVIENGELEFKVKALNNSLSGTVLKYMDGGVFAFDEQTNTLKYKYQVTKFYLLALFMAIPAFFVVPYIIMPIIGTIWLLGVGTIYFYISNNFFLGRLLGKIGIL